MSRPTRFLSFMPLGKVATRQESTLPDTICAGERVCSAPHVRVFVYATRALCHAQRDRST